MAFVGKIQKESKHKKADVSVTTSEGRIGLLIRNKKMAPGTLIDVQVGTDEDFGFIRIAVGTGTAAKAFGKTGKSVSWSAVRSISKSLPNMRRQECTIIETEENGSLIVDLGLPEGTQPIAYKAEAPVAEAPAPVDPAAAALGL